MSDPYRILYPNTRENTYTPSGVNQFNPSRLDFFLISNSLADAVKNVVIPHLLSSAAFDHKPVSLIFTKRENPFNFFIKDNFIQQEEFGAGVHIAVVKCYIIHASLTANFTNNIKEYIIRLIGGATLILTELQELKLREANNGSNAQLILQIEGKRAELRENLDNLPSTEFLDILILEPSPDIFLETLILCVKKNALLEHCRSIAVNNVKKNELIAKVKSLKKLSPADRDVNAIIRAESALTSHVENELKIELENYRKFENVNSEKITPHFMSMVKSSNKNDCPSSICDNNGTQFEISENLKSYVGGYFKNIYKKEANLENLRGPNTIKRVLGRGCFE
jgi:hypothetical protein